MTGVGSMFLAFAVFRKFLSHQWPSGRQGLKERILDLIGRGCTSLM